MTTRPSGETRHRWTRAEVTRLLELSKSHGPTVAEAADALYVTLGMSYRAVYAKLYEQWLKGRAPHLTVVREPRKGEEFGASFLAAVREMARAMRVEGVTDMLIYTRGQRLTVEVQRASTTIELPFEQED